MSTFSYNINNSTEDIGTLKFNISNNLFNTINSFIILQNTTPIIDIKSNLNLELDLIGNINYKIEICWSYDNLFFTDYVLYTNNNTCFNNFTYNNNETWFKIKFTQLSVGASILNSILLKWDRMIDNIGYSYTINPNETKTLIVEDIYKIFSIDNTIIKTTPESSLLRILFKYTQNNGRSWSNWIPFEQDKIKTIRFSKLLFTKFIFNITNTDSVPVRLLDLDIVGNFFNITKKSTTLSKLGLRTNCLGYENDIDNGECDSCNTIDNVYIACDDCDDNKPTFNPYTIGKLPAFFNYLNNSISDIWGKNVHYFKHTPDENSIDYDLHEYPKMNIENGDYKEIKIIVPKNIFPSNEIKFTGFNLDLFESFEIHITKDEFKRAFGIEERPGKKDILFICELNRLYEVEHLLPSKGALNMSMFYRVRLKKYNIDANTDILDNNADTALNSLISNSSLNAIFNNEIKESNKNSALPDQLSLLSSNIYDRRLDKSTMFENIDLYNGQSLVNKYSYKLPYKNRKFITFIGGDNRMDINENRSINLWFNLTEYNSNFVFQLIKNNYTNNGYDVLLSNNKIIFNLNDGTFEANFIPSINVWYLLTLNIDQINNKINILIHKRQSELGTDYKSLQLINIVNKEIAHLPKVFQHSGMLVFGMINTNNINSKSFMYITGIKILNNILNDSDIYNINSLSILKNENKVILIDNAEEQLKLKNMGNI